MTTTTTTTSLSAISSLSAASGERRVRICRFPSSTVGRGAKLNSLGLSNKLGNRARFSVRADDSGRGSGSDFVAGFILGGAIFGTLAYVFAPQIRKSLLNEDEYGFRKAKRPIYYDDGLEKTRQTLNDKISQLNSAIDNVSSRLRGSSNMPDVPVETDPGVEATT
ncbi:hypothetical protein MLD38_029040 [Melastoma candidum]|uniref:Uncharacterized protein n=1 Tax=Melastoma candidum TaxID=119954 RepID=A0ACB9N526_9MYRT|nr:hypothetical protein MLD38_029040 [Melastoma candidum]